MNVDYSFIRLVKNDFNKAKNSDNPNIAEIIYGGFLMQLPNETFLQISDNSDGITFAGAIQVDLIDCSENIVKNIDNKFFYETFVDENGINQIAFEFGMVEENYFTLPLHLKITDLINDNIYYSNGFLVTDYYSKNSSRFDYKKKKETFIKSIRVSNCYYYTPQNKLDLKSYTTTSGLEVSYNFTPTYLQKFKIDTLDFFANDRLSNLFCHQIIYLNSNRVTISEFKSDERKGNTNYLSAEFVVNPQNQIYNWSYQLYIGLEVTTLIYPHNTYYTEASAETFLLVNNAGKFLVKFNVPINNFTNCIIKLYKDGILIGQTIVVSLSSIIAFEFAPEDVNFDYSIGNYMITATPINDWNGFAVNEWNFYITLADYDGLDYDSNDYLTD